METERNEFELAPALPISSTGVLWDLDEAAYLRWWRSLPHIDRSEFLDIHKGDEVLARFVCALWYLGYVQGRGNAVGTIIQAYGIAVRLNPSSQECRVRAAKAWRHDATQTLLNRLHQRSDTEAKARIVNSTTHLIETAINEAGTASLKEKALVIQAALKFVQMVEHKEEIDSLERRKRGWITIQQEQGKELSGEPEKPEEHQLKLYLTMAKEAFGEDRIRELLSGG